MKNAQRMSSILHVALRPDFGICLFLSQFTSNRHTLRTDNLYLLIGGTFCIVCAILLFITASRQLRKSAEAKEVATKGPFKYVRHPIYAGIYVFSVGLGFFFASLWFVVMVTFAPLWSLECKEEEKEIEELHGQSYIVYQERTGMFFPLKRR